MEDQIAETYEIPATINESAYVFLRRAILLGKFKPGQKITQQEIADLYNMSTTPVREAFKRLSSEGYLTISARKGFMITPFSVEDMVDLFEVANLLDVRVTIHAMSVMGPKDIEVLRRMTDELEEAFKKKSLSTYIEKNLQVHMEIWKHCTNKLLQNMMKDTGEKFTFCSFQFFQTIRDPENFLRLSFLSHVELNDALKRKDSATVEKLLSKHWGGDFLGGRYSGR